MLRRPLQYTIDGLNGPFPGRIVDVVAVLLGGFKFVASTGMRRYSAWAHKKADVEPRLVVATSAIEIANYLLQFGPGTRATEFVIKGSREVSALESI